ncbi:hypothetical protein AGLY_018150 [Aphis glycines]|uniref:Uncharacterized protein n=1 Tax=Aphis glycines TaxID=307491 RepID=A0A6G0SST1_APHGL|nr:hypothetical protein AGLY_018150 [Aphis glycines]
MISVILAKVYTRDHSCFLYQSISLKFLNVCKMDSRKERLRFSTKDDLCLLRQVICLNPYNDINQWSIIKDALVSTSNKNFSIRSVKEHKMELIKKSKFIHIHIDGIVFGVFTEADAFSRQAPVIFFAKIHCTISGTEEEYGEKCQLLQEINDMYRDFNKKQVKDKNEGYRDRINTTEGTAVNDDTITQNNMIEVTLDNVHNPIDATCIDIPSTSRLGNLLNCTGISSNFGKIPQNHNTFENHFLVKRIIEFIFNTISIT